MINSVSKLIAITVIGTMVISSSSNISVNAKTIKSPTVHAGMSCAIGNMLKSKITVDAKETVKEIDNDTPKATAKNPTVIDTGEYAEVGTEEFTKVEATAYTPTGCRTASGVYPTVNHTVAMNRENLGKTIEIYRVADDGSVGERMGTYRIEDTGGQAHLRNGTRIDIFMGTESEAIQWGIKQVYIRFVD